MRENSQGSATAMERLGIVADDLTGALDSAAPFVHRGLAVQVALSADSITTEPDVVAVSTESRHSTTSTAASLAHHAADALLRTGCKRLFVKVDSMLRGEPDAASRGVSAAAGTAQRIICTAYPSHERTIVRGILIVKGSESRIDLRERFSNSVVLGDRSPSDGRLSETTTAVILDATTDEDLDRIIATAPARAVLVGSAGLASAIARTMPPRRSRPAVHPMGPRAPLVVVGTPHTVSRTQLTAIPRSRIVTVDPRRPEDGLERARASYSPTGEPVVLCSPSERLPDGHSSDGILAEAAASAVAAGARTLVLTGGATAAAVLDRLGVSTLEVRGELEPGVVISEAPAHELVVVTKSGSFGTPLTLQNIIDALRADSATEMELT